MKIIIDAGTYGKTVECETISAAIDEIARSIKDHAALIKVFIVHKGETRSESESGGDGA